LRTRLGNLIVRWCNGSTADFGSACQGSNPCRTTRGVIYHSMAWRYWRGRESPILLTVKKEMYTKNLIENLVNEHISNSELFLVKLSVSPKNVIRVYIDSEAGVGIDECIALSRHIESNLDREKEDFELEVSSYGIGDPLLMRRQYVKSMHKQLSVVCKDSKKLEGELKSVTDEGIELKLKLSRKQIKDKIPDTQIISWENIKESSIILSFK
jgi:ribosome maturation factor RimP